jgi:hypothetical protein
VLKPKNCTSQEQYASDREYKLTEKNLNNTVIGMVNDFLKRKPLLSNGILHKNPL